MKFRQNKKRIDPRYFLNEQDDEVYQDVTGKIIQGSGGAGSEVMFYDEGGAYTKDDDEISASMEKFGDLPSGWQDRVSNTLVRDAAEQYAMKKNLSEVELTSTTTSQKPPVSSETEWPPPPVDPEKIGGRMTTLPRQSTPVQYGTLPQTDYDPDAPPMGKLDIEKDLATSQSAHDVETQSAIDRIEAEREYEADIQSYGDKDPATGAPLQKQMPSTEHGVAPETLAPYAAYTPESGIRLLTKKRAYAAPETVRTLNHIADKGGTGIVLGDISKKGGGKISGHGSHQHGKDVDIALVLKPEAGGSSHNEPGGPDYGKHSQFRSAKAEDMDYDVSWKQVRAMADPLPGENTPAVKYAFVDARFIPNLYARAYRSYINDVKNKPGVTQEEVTAERDAIVKLFGLDPEKNRTYNEDPFKYKDGIVRHTKNHDDHWHIRLRESVEPNKDLIKEIVDKVVDELTNISN